MQRLTSNPVQELRRILKDQYSFSSIIKELIQNADDAGATEFHLGWVPEWPKATHPLLAGPAMLCLNNGEFRSADAAAIWHLDEGAKGGDVGTIGKYGLGMKSVFHLCEGFFYAASANQPAAASEPFVELLNPWPEGGPHDDWDDITSANTAIVNRITAWAHGSSRWFSLVIPLRTEDHLNGAEAILPGQFPKVRDLVDSCRAHELATLTTLLRSLESITVWSWNEDRTALTVETQLQLDGASCSRRAFPNIEHGESRPIRAEVVAMGSPTRTLLRASGIEMLSNDEEFQTLKQDRRWPKNFTLNPVTGRSEDTLEKAEPHCAAVFTETGASSGALRIRTAVFLPLAKGESEEIDCDGPTHFELILHGQFFLDAGRRALYQNDGVHGSLQEDWNDLLLRQGVRPLVCPALDEFVRAWEVPDAEVRALTQTLAASRLFCQSRVEICRSVNWLKRVAFVPEASRWCVEPSSTGFIEIPRLTGRAGDAVRILPALKQLAESHVLVEREEPRLTLDDATPWHEAKSELETVLSDLEIDQLVNENALLYLADFLCPLKEVMPSLPCKALVSKLRDCVSRHGVRTLEEAGNAFRQVIQASPTSTWVRIGPLEKDAASIYRDLNTRHVEHVLLPPELCPKEDGDALEVTEARTIVAWLEETRERRAAERTASLAMHVIRATEPPLAQKRELLGKHRVLLARSGEGDTPSATFSWNELAELFSQGCLFAGRSSLLTALQQALHDTHVYSLFAPSRVDGFQVLFEADKPKQCDVDACLQLLMKNRPLLAAPTQRIALLKRLVTSVDQSSSPADIAALRYLLHGNQAKAEDAHSLLLLRPSSVGGDHWGRVAQHALRRLGEEWRWIPEELWRGLTPEQQDVLSVQPIGVPAIEELLSGAGTGWIEELGLSEPERVSLLTEIRTASIWRSLPLHVRVDGARVSLGTRRAYLQPHAGVVVPPRMLDSIDVLAKPQTESLLQRYRAEGIELWSAETVINVALSAETPARFAIEILDALESLRQSASGLSSEMLARLRNQTWLPTTGGAAVAPCDVIALPTMDAYLQKLLADPEVAHAFTCVADLTTAVRRHSAFTLLSQKHILPDVRQSLAILAECLGAAATYRLGMLEEFEDESKAVKALLVSFRRADPVWLPALSLLQALADAFPDRLTEFAQVVLPPLRGELPIEALKHCVSALSEVAYEKSNQYIVTGRRLLRAYLKDLRGHPRYEPALLRGLALPNRAGRLTNADTLCARAEGIDPAHMLAVDLSELFPIDRESPTPEAAIIDDEEHLTPELSASTLLHYLRQWEGLVSKPIRGGLLSLFGDLDAIREEAANLLRPRSVEGFRSELEWPQYDFSKMTGANEPVRESMERQRFIFQLGDATSTRQVPNLLGEWFSAPIGGEISSIFVGTFWGSAPSRLAPPGFRTKLVTLREFDAGELSLQHRHEVLYESARILLKDAYNKWPDNLSEVWSALEESSQLALEIVQDQLLKNAWFYFQQLGDGTLAGLTDLLREYDDLSDREIELKRSKAASATRDLSAVHERLLSLPNDLRCRIENDRQVQAEALAAVREKMRAYEYSADSVPFELFQNSDDAAAELTDMLGSGTPNTARRIVFQLDDEHLSVVHWGRPINEFCRGDFPADVGREREYDKDLKKMLILSASAKGQRAELVTGKFGLGFKSVFFLTDRPEAVSSTLAFEVLGGFLPRELAAETTRELNALVIGDGSSHVESTVIRLPLAEGVAARAHQAITAFGDLLPITLAFSRCLKEATVKTSHVDWVFMHHETPLATDGLVSCCRVSCDLESSSLAALKFLKLSAGGVGAVLLAIDANGFEPLPNHVPTYWVTTPTRTRRKAGVVVHGQFAVDVGRNQLAESPANLETAGRIGRAAGRALVTLFDEAEDCDSLRQSLGLSHDVTPEAFWQSLWGVVTNEKIRHDQLLAAIFCDPGTGIHHLTQERRALPTGLPHPFDELTSLPKVRARVVGLIDVCEKQLAQVLPWPAVAGKWNPGELVSEARISNVLYPTRNEADEATSSVALVDFAACEIGDSIEVSPETASRLGEVITRRMLQDWENRPEYAKEVDELRSYFRDLRFRTECGGCGIVTDLVAVKVGADEGLRAAFGPRDRLLHSDYTGPGIEFFLACRAELRAPVTLLADWARGARSADTRKAALDYILRGELGLSGQLLGDGMESWIDEIPEDLMSQFTEQEQLQIRAKLGLGISRLREALRAEILEELDADEPFESVVYDTELALQRICEWWQAERDVETARLNARLYPDGHFFALRSIAPDTSEERQEWLKLFLLGSLQTIGWTSPEANRNFLQECTDRGWLRDLADNPSQPGCWLESLMRYVGEQESEIKYFQWMRYLVGLAIINEHLEDYVELFLAVDRIEQDFALDSIAAPRTSAFFQGGGPDAPPISEILGIGQCFIMRELMRHGVLKDENVYPHCYVPFERTRRVVTRLGGPQFEQAEKRWDRSRSIYSFLSDYLADRATFGLCFDLPLWLIGDADRPELSERLLE